MTCQLKIHHLSLLLFIAACANDLSPDKMPIDSSRKNFFGLMEEHDGHQLTLTTDLTNLLLNKEAETNQPAILSCKKGKVDCFQIDMKVSPRGKTRKKYCSFPPLKLDFNKDDLLMRGLNKIDHFKLVTHCKEDDINEEILLKEYVVYQLYNILTEKSLSAQLLNITYKDSEQKVEDIEKHAFLIEPIDGLCLRQKSVQLEDPNQKLKSIDAEQYKLLTLFQYMIGNTDWNLSKRHNIKLIKEGRRSPVPIPYDFDYSGLVNAHYALPHPQLPIKNVRQRLFQYRSKDPDLENALNHFFRQKEALLAYCQNFKYLDEVSKTELNTYLESFYTIIEDPDLREEKLFKKK